MGTKVRAKIGNFEVVFGNERILPTTGLALVGRMIDKSKLVQLSDQLVIPKRPQPYIKNSDVIKTYIGLLAQGKTDYECVNEMMDDPEYYIDALGLSRSIPSEATLRQRMDAIGDRLRTPILRTNASMFISSGVKPTANTQGFVPIDVDVSPFDNSDTKKEGVSRTYAGYDGYAPNFAYIGTEGYMVNAELREGKHHCQKGTADFLWETFHYAKQMTDGNLLLRMDAGNDSAENIGVCFDNNVDFLIKRNLRNETPEWWRFGAVLMDCQNVTHPREGKTVYIGSIFRTLDVPHADGRVTKERIRVVYEITERTIDKQGQMMLIPTVDANTWHTTLELPEEEIIALYHTHAQCEQYHSELKSDMGVERLPSGKFATNALVLELAMVAYNLLRMTGQESLKYPDTPLKRPVKRRRISTVIKHLMFMAAHLTLHARKKRLALGRSNTWRWAFARLCRRFA